MLIGLPDLVKERKLSKIVMNRRLPNLYYYILRDFPIQNFHITRYYIDGEYCHSFVVAAGDSQNISRSSDAQRRSPYGSFTSGDVEHEA